MENFLNKLGIKKPKEMLKVPISNIEETEKPIKNQKTISKEDLQKLIEEPFDKNTESLTEAERNYYHTEKNRLSDELKHHVAREKYEEAARIRDDISEINKKLDK